MISPAPLPALLPRVDITRLHYTPTQPVPRHFSDGMTLLQRALPYVPVSVIRIERGVPTRVIRALRPEEVGTHRLLPGVTAYAWAFRHQEDTHPPQTVMIVVAASDVRAPHPDEKLEFWGRHGPVIDGRELHPRTAPKDPRPAAPVPARPDPPPRRAKPAAPRPDGRAGKKGPKNKGRRKRR